MSRKKDLLVCIITVHAVLVHMNTNQWLRLALTIDKLILVANDSKLHLRKTENKVGFKCA